MIEQSRHYGILSMKTIYSNNKVNSTICCAKEARTSIVLNIEWVQFALQNCEKLHSVRGLYDKKAAPHSTVYHRCDVQKMCKK